MKPRVAFYAPMKSPDFPVPSGDQRIARLFIQALELAGNDVELASELRSWEGAGDLSQQKDIKETALKEAKLLLEEYRAREASGRPDFWFTYHLYHKAPDWIGPYVCEGLGIPYLVAECSVADKQIQGPWHSGWEASRQAITQADAVISLNPEDVDALRQLLPPSKLHYLPPFLDLMPVDTISKEKLAEITGFDMGIPWLVAVGMMRPGDKTASYKLLAKSLSDLSSNEWQLVIIGDGRNRQEVEHLFLPFGSKVYFSGELPIDTVRQWLPCFDLFVWPAINEAIGMAMLEAMAACVPVLSGPSPALDSLSHQCPGLQVLNDTRWQTFSNALDISLKKPELFTSKGLDARRVVERTCSLDSAALELARILGDLR